MSDDFRITFQVGRRVWVIRALMWGMLLFSGLMLYLIVQMPALGEDPTASVSEQIALIIIVLMVAIAFPLGMHIYGSCYVARVISNEDESVSFYDTISWLGFRRWTIRHNEQGEETHHKGHSKGFYSASLDITMMEVNAPYTSQKVSTRRLPFIFDDVGDWVTWHQGQSVKVK